MSSIPACSAGPEIVWLTDDGQVPNNRSLPVLLYRQSLPVDPARVEALVAGNGWDGCWRNGIYPFHHFHSTAHEALVIVRGQVRVRLGGASGRSFELKAGDGVVLPAGTGHRNEDSSAELLVIGCYPGGQSWDLCRAGEADPEAARQRIEAVPLPGSDPFFGASGPLSRLWTRSEG